MTAAAPSFLAAACVSRSQGPQPIGVPAAVPPAELSGLTLRVGDQKGNSQAVMEAAGVLKDVPYKISYSQFQSGPALIAAETGGSVDLGKMSETPLVFAQNAGSPVKVVYAATPID